MDWASQALSIFGAFSAGALSLYGLVRWKTIRKPADYFAEIRRVEQLAVGGSGPAEDPDARLQKLRQELIEDVCAGRIKGDHAIANILLLLKEVRATLPRPDGERSTATTLRVRHATASAA